MNAPLRLLPAPSPPPMGTGPVACGDDAPGVFVRGDQAAFMSGLLTGAVSGVLDGAPDRAALSLCVHALRAAEILAASDMSGQAEAMVGVFMERLKRATDLAEMPAEGSKQ